MQTINGLLNAQKHLGIRRNQLNELRLQSTRRSIWADKDKTEEPVYDVVTVDEMITEIDIAMMKIDEAIKEANARTSVEISVDLAHLMRPIKREKE